MRSQAVVTFFLILTIIIIIIIPAILIDGKGGGSGGISGAYAQPVTGGAVAGAAAAAANWTDTGAFPNSSISSSSSSYSFSSLSTDEKELEEQEQGQQLKVYSIGVYLINIGKIDLQTGSYDLDFYIWLASNDGSTNFVQDQPRIDFMNALRATVDPSRVEPSYYEARVKGTFLKNMDFRNYPFDKQRVTVEVEGFETIDRLVFVPDVSASGFDRLINVPGWNLGSSSSEVTTHEYPDGTYSRYIFAFTIERAALSSFLKTIFPVIIITTIAMLAFWMSPTNFPPRIGLAASTLLAAVASHLAAANQLPPIGYLTLMDKVMIVVYALFLNNLLSMVLQMRLVDNKKEEQAVKVNAKMRRLMPVIIGVILLVLVPFDFGTS